MYELNPLDALQFCLFSHQREHYLEHLIERVAEAPPSLEDEMPKEVLHKWINSINIMPLRIEVEGAHIWKEKDMSKIEDLKTLEKTFDWSFSTPYKGTLHPSFKAVYDLINSA